MILEQNSFLLCSVEKISALHCANAGGKQKSATEISSAPKIFSAALGAKG
jgi:hypothetical protein